MCKTETLVPATTIQLRGGLRFLPDHTIPGAKAACAARDRLGRGQRVIWRIFRASSRVRFMRCTVRRHPAFVGPNCVRPGCRAEQRSAGCRAEQRSAGWGPKALRPYDYNYGSDSSSWFHGTSSSASGLSLGIFAIQFPAPRVRENVIADIQQFFLIADNALEVILLPHRSGRIVPKFSNSAGDGGFKPGCPGRQRARSHRWYGICGADG